MLQVRLQENASKNLYSNHIILTLGAVVTLFGQIRIVPSFRVSDADKSCAPKNKRVKAAKAIDPNDPKFLYS